MRKKAEAEKKRKEAEALDAKLREEKEIKANEELGESGLRYLQNMAQIHEKEKIEKSNSKSNPYAQSIPTFEEMKQ